MRLNNKGFAISGVLYSMLILIVTLMFLVLGILSSRRTTLSKISNESQQDVEERVQEITKCVLGDSVLYQYNATNLEQVVELEPGQYFIQAWGARGAAYNGNAGGKGAYVSTVYETPTKQSLYLNLGYNNGTITTVPSYNGGGASKYGGTGGGATSIATVPGELSTLEDNSDAIILVAAGGGGAGYSRAGGAGGDLSIGLKGSGANIKYGGTGATETNGGTGGAIYNNKELSPGKDGRFGQGGNAGYHSSTYGGGGGGGGYYGGGGGTSGASSANGSGGGGVSYINPDSLLQTQELFNNGKIIISNKYYTDYIGVGINGDSTMPKPNPSTARPEYILTETQTGNNANGYVRITKLTCKTYKY